MDTKKQTILEEINKMRNMMHLPLIEQETDPRFAYAQSAYQTGGDTEAAGPYNNNLVDQALGGKDYVNANDITSLLRDSKLMHKYYAEAYKGNQKIGDVDVEGTIQRFDLIPQGNYYVHKIATTDFTGGWPSQKRQILSAMQSIAGQRGISEPIIIIFVYVGGSVGFLNASQKQEPVITKMNR